MEHSDRIRFFDKANRILEEALELPENERERFIAASCSGAQELHAELRRLIGLFGDMDNSQDAALQLSSPDLQPGDLLAGRFTILKKIGEGGMGSVFLSDDAELGPVALKTARADRWGSPEWTDQLRNEVRVARAVAHPNVCPIFDLVPFGRNGGPVTAALTMKYLPGESLGERLKRGSLATTEALQIAKGIAAGIDALHAAGIVHGDIKPANIILTTGRDGVERPVIADFGMARAEEDGNRTVPRGICGSPFYMAPETFRNVPTTRASDIYSFGLVLFEMITGKRPFPEEDLLAMAVRRACDDPPSVSSMAPGVPNSWNQALARALDRSPERRPNSACATVAEIERPPVECGRSSQATVTLGAEALRRACGHSRNCRRAWHEFNSRFHRS